MSAPLGGARVTDGHAAQPRSQSDVDALKESLFSDLRTAKRNGYEDSQILQALLNRKGRLTAPPPAAFCETISKQSKMAPEDTSVLNNNVSKNSSRVQK